MRLPALPMLRLPALISALALAAGFAAPFAAPARADEVVMLQPIKRPFPQGQFCALPVRLGFVSPTDAVVVTFTARVFVDDGSGTLQWTNQCVDNVTLATSSQVSANFAGPPPFSASENCYIGDPSPTEYFHFNAAGLTFALRELCDTDPAPRGWDLSNDAFFTTDHGAPRDVDNDTDYSGGSIALGHDSATPSASVFASASIQVGGLTSGESYDLGAWWFANFVRFPHDTDYLTVEIKTLGGTPVARRSWGAVKSSYR